MSAKLIETSLKIHEGVSAANNAYRAYKTQINEYRPKDISVMFLDLYYYQEYTLILENRNLHMQMLTL